MRKLLALIGMILIVLSLSGHTEGVGRGFVPVAAVQFAAFGAVVAAGVMPIRRKLRYIAYNHNQESKKEIKNDRLRDRQAIEKYGNPTDAHQLQ